MTTEIETLKPQTNNLIQRAWSVVRHDLRAYIILNIVYYGLVILCMAYVAFINPGLQESMLKTVGSTFTSGPLAAVGGAYTGGKVIQAMMLTFVINLILGSLIQITLPSLIIPFSGLLMGIYRAALWGLLLSPSNASLSGAMIPHSLTLVVEGQAYILVMLASAVQGWAFLNPKAYGISGHLNGYKEGLRRTRWIYLLVVILLAVAAVYEALEVIFLAPLFQ